MNTPVFVVSDVSGIMGLPASFFRGEMLTAHRIDAMLMKREVLAMRRPGQILRQRIMKKFGVDRTATITWVQSPVREFFQEKADERTWMITYKSHMSYVSLECVVEYWNDEVWAPGKVTF